MNDRTEQKATRYSWLETPEPQFLYALSEVVFQFLKNDGDLPLLALNDRFVVARGSEREVLDVAFEMELTSPESQLREDDIVATWGSELWLGEATRSNRLEGTNSDEIERLERLAETAKALSARGVIFVTTAPAFRPQTKGRMARTFADPEGPEVVFIEAFNAYPVAE